MSLLKVRNIETYYGPIMAIKGISFDVPEGAIVTILGANGAGKTTILKTISGIMDPEKGTIEFMGKRIDSMAPEKIVALGISQVPEGREVFHDLTVKENLLMGAYLRKDKNAVRKDLDIVYDYFPILRERTAQLTGGMSGGQQQMVVIARALMARPTLEVLRSEPRENFTQKRVRLGLAPGQTCEGWLLVPAGEGPFGAVLVPFYEPETSIGLGKPGRDFAYQLTRRGFVTLSIGSPGGDAWKPERGGAICQPLSFLAYLAANGANALASLPEVDPERLGVVGHSYGGKWALFAGALCDRFAAVAVSDPGIVWDEARPNVNYWEPWYLGLDPRRTRQPGVVTAENPRTGAYQQLVEAGRDLHELHALIAPRPLLVSGGSEDPPERWRALNHTVAVNRLLGFTNRVAMTNRATHDPTPESNAQLYRFFEWALGGRPMTPSSTR